MISLILPYWDRQAAADKALGLLAQQYLGLDLEVIVVDDGNAVPFRVPDVPLNIRVVRMPAKDKPTPQSKAWNAGVAAAKGDIIALSCVEILHTEPVLPELVKQLREIGPTGYVLASAWCPDEKKWHCHTTEHIPSCPPGTGPAFLGLMFRDMFLRSGGFDESYHDGCGYEDKDFIWRMTEAGAVFCIRDDLTVIHPKAGARIQWEPGGFERNARMYFAKWHGHKPVTFVCLKAGNAYGPEYVNILRDMVARNLPHGFAGKFVCITDDPIGLDDGIDVIPLPDDLETWYGKLYMFKRGVFHDGTRCIFLDLDTLIVGNIGEIAKYDGKFGTLQDFYHPHRVGPAVIAWEAGEYVGRIWDEWEAEGKPRNPMGDLWWINGRTWLDIDILQEKFPGKFVSFKAHCAPYPPTSASVVCFHGQPKPDNCNVEWVADVWKIGGAGMPQLEAVANTVHQKIADNVRSACARDLPWIEFKPEHHGHCVIVGGGPSVRDTMPEILWRKSNGQTIIATNGTAKLLNDHGIVPDLHIIIDARPENAKFLEGEAAECYLASQCDPALFDAAKNVTLFHMNTAGIADLLPAGRTAHLISSGTTVGLAAMAIAYVLGYRTMHLHGFDSSFDESHHAYEQKQNDADPVIDVSVNGEKFKSTPWMVKQVQQFQELAAQLANEGVTITVAGRGLLPYVAHCMSA